MADILTPALGESVTEATIGKWTKKAGDPVKKDEVLVELETDKVSLEVVSPADGALAEIKAADGETVTPGAVLGVVSEGASAAPSAPKAADAPKADAASPAAAPAAIEPAAFTTDRSLRTLYHAGAADQGAIALVWTDNPFENDSDIFGNYRVYSASFDIDASQLAEAEA